MRMAVTVGSADRALAHLRVGLTLPFGRCLRLGNSRSRPRDLRVTFNCYFQLFSTDGAVHASDILDIIPAEHHAFIYHDLLVNSNVFTSHG